jgi:ribosomal protein S18 acetylase RimI-like enzyme
MIVRRLGARDLDVFRDLRLRSLRRDPDNYASDYEDWINYPDARWLAYLDEPVFAAFVEGAAVGLIGLIPQTRARMAHRTGLAMVWVDEDRRGEGVADALLTACLDMARGLGCLQVELSVNAENARAVRFYERHGFRCYGRLPRGFRTPTGFVDDIEMVLLLD